jgi:glycosyltransferase involved in cell wall biosynthesis
MRVLVVSNSPFQPADAGNRRRIDRMIAYLREHGIEVGMLLLPDPYAGTCDPGGMAARLDHLELAAPPRPRHLALRAVRRFGRLIRRHSSETVDVDAWCPTWFRERTAALIRSWRPDAVLVQYVFLSACLDGRDAGTLGIIDTHDLMHHRAAAYAAAGLTPQWFRTSYEEERRGLLRADAVLAISESDATVLRRMLPTRDVLFVPHGAVSAPAPMDAAAPARVLFVASYNDLNVAGLSWFLETAWDALRGVVPGIELVVCGTIAEKLGPLPAGVSVRGFVPALAEEYARARVVIDPVRGATGLHVKLVEALGHGRPVVSTAAVAQAGDGDGVLVADTPDTFVQTIQQLVEDEALWRQTCAAAAVRATREFSPDVAFAPLLRWLRERTESGGGLQRMRR